MLENQTAKVTVSPQGSIAISPLRLFLEKFGNQSNSLVK